MVDVLAAHSVLILLGKQLLMAQKFYPTVFLSALTGVQLIQGAGDQHLSRGPREALANRNDEMGL